MTNEETTPKKKKYLITQTQPATQIWYYEVEAESEEIAMHLVMSGEVDVIDYSVEGDMQDFYDFEVIDVDDIEEVNNA